MITFVSVLKPCDGRTGAAQRRAVASWTRLAGPSNVLLLGDEAGVELLSRELGTRWSPNLGRNGHGTPLLDSAFAAAHAASETPLLCFLNGDIVLDARFLEAAAKVQAQLTSFLMVGQCTNLDVPDDLAADEASVERLFALGRERGTLRGHDFVDYFLFSRDLFHAVPPFALGRAGFDNWLIWGARAAGAAVVNASACQRPIHQNHDYGHIDGGAATAYRGVEATENLRLAQGRLLTTLDATHLLTPRGLRPDLLGRLHLRRRLLLARIAAAGALRRRSG